jgi:hypothetical protein
LIIWKWLPSPEHAAHSFVMGAATECRPNIRGL